MMAGKYLCIALFAMLQISFVLCRSTGTPDALVEESVMPTGEAVNAEALKQTVVPGKMANDVPIYEKAYSDQTDTPSYAAAIGIAYAVFVFVSFILGCMMYFYCKKEPRQGYVIGDNSRLQPETTM